MKVQSERIAMQRKVFKTGNSLVISLPKDLLESLGIKNGTEVSVEFDRKNRQILIRPTELPLAGDLSQEFARQVNEFIDQYRPTLEALSKK
jgi:antitoxin MazE